MNIVPSLIVLLVCQLAGTAAQQAFSLPVPGAVIGMVLLFAGLMVRRKVSEDLQVTSLTLLRYLPLLFVPAGVGVMQQFGLMQREWLPITAALVGSVLATIAFTGIVMQFCLRLSEKQSGGAGGARDE